MLNCNVRKKMNRPNSFILLAAIALNAQCMIHKTSLFHKIKINKTKAEKQYHRHS